MTISPITDHTGALLALDIDGTRHSLAALLGAARAAEIVEPRLRAHAVAAWERAGSPRLYPVEELAQHYHTARSNVLHWQRKGWCAGAWHWHGRAGGGQGRGTWYLVWAGPLPPPRQIVLGGYVRADKRDAAERRRAMVAEAIAAAGPPPRKGTPGSGAYWSEVASRAGLRDVSLARRYGRTEATP